ncbi:MAG: hypothetical protein KIT69_08180 [Propionibacteriaceae bacterium]|nr:hypothetical protein [Propionibacteriaceae bacterium]
MTASLSQHDWVLAAPFRAHLHHLQSSTGLSWEVLAWAAGVSPALVRHLVFGNNGRFSRRISPLPARRLAELSPGKLPQVARLPAVHPQVGLGRP